MYNSIICYLCNYRTISLVFGVPILCITILQISFMDRKGYHSWFCPCICSARGNQLVKVTITEEEVNCELCLEAISSWVKGQAFGFSWRGGGMNRRDGPRDAICTTLMQLVLKGRLESGKWALIHTTRLPIKAPPRSGLISTETDARKPYSLIILITPITLYTV